MNNCACGKKIGNKNKKCRPCHDKARGKSNGLFRSSIYNRWWLMMRRCYRKNDPRYDDYGGRGIKVCESWHIFLNYYNDVGDVPFEGAELDRINPEGDYEPSNCKWVTASENMQNTRRSKKNKKNFKIIHKDKLCSDCRAKLFIN